MTIKIKIPSKNILQVFSLSYLMLMGLVSGFIEHGAIWRVVLVAVIAMAILCDSAMRRAFLSNAKQMLLLMIIIAVIIVLNVGVTVPTKWLGNNIRSLVYSYAILLGYLSLLKSRNDTIGAFIRSQNTFFIINFFWLINLIIIFLQINIHGFLIKAEWLQKNQNYADQCSGLFGYSGTHDLSYFSVFVVVYNLFYYYFVSKKKNKIIVIYTYVTVLFMCYLARHNDNSALYFLYLMFILSFYVLKTYWTNKNIIKIIGKWIGIVIIISLVVFLSLRIPAVNSYFNDLVFVRLERIISAQGVGATEGSERLAIVREALRQGKGLFGYGIGAHSFGEDINNRFLGWYHFGLNSMTGFLVLGGLPFYIANMFLFTAALYNLYKKNRDFLYYVMIMVILFFSTFYTVIFTSCVSLIWLEFSFCVFYMMQKAIFEKKSRFQSAGSSLQ